MRVDKGLAENGVSHRPHTALGMAKGFNICRNWQQTNALKSSMCFLDSSFLCGSMSCVQARSDVDPQDPCRVNDLILRESSLEQSGFEVSCPRNHLHLGIILLKPHTRRRQVARVWGSVLSCNTRPVRPVSRARRVSGEIASP